MNVGSLFSGIGGIDLGLERAGMRVIWQVECDPYARAVLRKHWPEVPRHEDVRNVGAANLAAVDLICGGFPCQDVSNAGAREGIGGERSGLWSEYARIVREIRPRYVLVENVAALLARGLGRVVGDLAACGYDADWDCVPAAAFGAPHLRDRIFVVAHSYCDARRVQSKPRDKRRDPAISRHDGAAQPLAYPAIFRPRKSPNEADAESESRASRPLLGHGGWWTSEPSVGRVADGIPDRLAWERELGVLGNAVVPQVAEYIGRLILAHAKAS